MAVEQDWQRLAKCVRDRRGDLGLTQEEVSAAGGPSTPSLRVIERGQQSRYKPASLRRLENALQWQRGSVRAILDGGEPVPVAGSAAPAPAAPPHQPAAGAAPASPLLSLVAAALEDELARNEADAWAETGLDRRQYADYRGAVPGVTFAHPAEAALMNMEYTPLGQRVRWIAEFRAVRARPPAVPDSRRTA